MSPTEDDLWRLQFEGRWREALAAATSLAEQQDGPSWSRIGQGELLLGLGHYAEGWDAYEARLAFPERFATEQMPFRPWAGELLAGKTLMVWREQGLGDMIMLARFYPILRDMGARVVVCSARKLMRIHLAQGLEAFPFPVDEAQPLAAPDYYIHPFSIPHRLGITLENLPNAPYITGQRIPGPPVKIGVKWRGRESHPHDAQRSLTPELAAELLALPGAFDLDPENSRARDFQDTANIIAGLDLVISVDTSVAHLAGAMGKPVFILLPAQGLDWRWMQEREDSPWYPSARLFRQPAPGDWASVIAAVKAAV